MGNGVERVQEKIKAFQKRYYLNIFVRGVLLTLSILCGYFLMAALLEYTLWLSPWLRLLLFFSFFSIAAWCVYKFLKEPLQWWLLKKGLNDEQSARIIGGSLPSVQDRLLNFLQLRVSGSNSALAYASIEQRSKEFEPITFDGFIDLRENKRYLKYLAAPLVIILIILVTNQAILTKSTDRILHFSNQYSPEAPFQFIVEHNSLSAFYNEDLTITLRLNGEAIPENAYIVKGDLRLKMEHAGTGEFTYVVEKIQEGFDFQFEAAGFYSAPYHIAVERRPELTGFTLQFEFPRYLNRKPEAVRNSGNAEIPEGTKVTWLLQTGSTQKATIAFKSDTTSISFQPTDDQNFTYSKRILSPDQYEIQLGNDKGASNKEKIAYTLDVIKDEFPKIVVGNLQDSVLYKRIVLGGNVSDDYGVSDLALHFRIRNDQQQDVVNRQVRIPVSKNIAQQSFYYNWNVDSLKLKPGQQLEYYLEVWDNDGVNGRKSTKTASYQFLVPSADNLVRDITKSQSQTQSQIDKSVNKANNLQDQIEQANQKLKGKNSLDWQDKKMLEDILQNKKGLDQVIEQMREENKLLEQKKEAFTEQDERIKEKAEQIQKLMDQLLDEETKKLFEELQKLMKENTDMSQIQKILDKLNQNTNNLEKELERTLELFKQLQFDYKLDQAINDIKEQVKDQKELLEKTEALDKKDSKGDKENKDKRGDKNNKGKDDDKKNNENKDGDKQGDKQNEKDSTAGNKDQDQKDQGNKGDKNQKDQDQKGQEQKNGENKDGAEQKPGEQNKELAKEQERLKEEMKKTAEQLEDLKKLGEELNKNEDMPPPEESDEIMQEQQQSEDQLNQNSPDKAKSPQQKALKKMQQMQQQMEGMQSAMEMQMEEENLEALRQIIHGLVKLSFDQEGLMKNFSELQQNDPRFNSLAQQQLKLKDDAKVLEDSLLALGKRDASMGGFINKEIGELNNHLDKVIEANKERKRPQAANEMQLSMTSINNLALMLDDHFDMMMQMMANAKPSMKKSKQKGQKPSQSLSQLQQQLNQKINDLKNGKKSGRELSEQLAEMAAEQERIRRAVQEMEKKMNEKNGGKTPGNDIAGKMEQTETELVNKQLTDQMIRRQQEILTRLLETEKSAREQDMDDERKGETAKDYEKEIPKAFEEYLRLKEKEVELLKTVPPKLYPYYKKEVSEYFKRMNENQSAQPK